MKEFLLKCAAGTIPDTAPAARVIIYNIIDIFYSDIM